MDFHRIAARVAGIDDTVKVHITEAPNTCTVTYLGETHSGVWPDDIDAGEWINVVGDVHLLSAAMTAWSGENDFEMTANELSRQSGGQWAPQASANVTLVLIHGPWGFMGYEVSGATPALAQLVTQANDAIFVKQNTRGGIEIVRDKGEYVDGDDGQWTSTTEAVLTDALQRAIAGDDQALILH